MKYGFYGKDTPSVKPINPKYQKIKDQRHLYELMQNVWCEYSCAPRMRNLWSEENNTAGQCSITSFLIQDIFGGEVYGVPLKEGGFHCYNVVNGVLFDLTSEQFGEEKLEYNMTNLQSREEHFASQEKYERYLYIKEKLEELIR
ncbi:MAG: hypothetical protein K6F07_02335 [Bacilli bacterium]|nr:hypothetical protein [Bacilli bacterium]